MRVMVGFVWYVISIEGQGATAAPSVPVLQVALAGNQGDLRATIEFHQGDIDGIQAGFDNRSGEMLGVVHCQAQQFTLPGNQSGSDSSGWEGCHWVAL